MFDFGRVGDLVGGLFGGGLQEAVANTGLSELLERTGIDPTALEGLDAAQVIDLLAQNGVDASILESIDLAALSEQLGQGGGVDAIAELIGRVTQR